MMIKYKVLTCLLVFLVIPGSCKKTIVYVNAEIVINELMPVNTTIATDQNGEYDDWIELHNLSSERIDVSGYFLTDNKNNVSKWIIPEGTSISGYGYLIIWADRDTTQAGLHANFKLSSLGEKLVLSKPDKTLIDEVVYPAQGFELSYSRNPDGTGEFKWQNPTFNRSNQLK
jgi:hypothetical protein